MTPTGNWAAALDDKRELTLRSYRLPPDALDIAAALEEAAVDLTALAARIRTEAFRPNQDIAFVAIRAKGEARAVYDNLAAVFSACIPQAVEG